MPLLTGATEDADRHFLYTEMLRDWRGMPPWYGLVTTHRFDADTIWHYTEYATGGHELYDLRADPYRLHNLARDPDQVKRLRKLHRLLHREVIRPDGVRIR
jgi:arylsulfatase A-like enzyme